MNSEQVFDPGFRVTDADDNPVSGAKVKFFESDGSTPRPVYSDAALSVSLGSIVYTRSDGKPVASSGSSTAVTVFTGPGTFQVEITDADDVVIHPLAVFKGPVDSSDFLPSDATTSIVLPVIAIAISSTLSASHKGKAINASGDITLTMDAAADLGDGWNVRIRCDDAANSIKLLTDSGSEVFKGPGFSGPAFALVGKGEAIEIACDGANFTISGYVPRLIRPDAPVLAIVDIVTSAPSSPAAGARYIVGSAFSTFSTGDVIEATGQATFLAYTPATDCGWLAYVQDEAATYQFVGSAWAQIIPIPAASDTLAGRAELAVQSEMEAATDVARIVTPGRQHFHPGHVKAGGNLNGSGTPAFASGDIGMGSVTDNATGNWTLALDTAFADTNYWVTGWARCVTDRANILTSQATFTKTASSMQVTAQRDDNTLADSAEMGICFWGLYA
jgi:hypothetical protein